MESRPVAFGSTEKIPCIEGGLTLRNISTSSSPTEAGFLPRASSTLCSVPKRFITRGKSDPSTFSNRRAGPPSLTVRDAISVISSSGETSVFILFRSPMLSRWLIKLSRFLKPFVDMRKDYSSSSLLHPLPVSTPTRPKSLSTYPLTTSEIDSAPM